MTGWAFLDLGNLKPPTEHFQTQTHGFCSLLHNQNDRFPWIRFNRKVVFATCTGAAVLHREMRRSGAADPKSLQFDVVVIDEAAQA